MKTLLISLTTLAVVAAPVFGEDQDKPKPPKSRPQRVQQAPPQRQVNQAPKNYTPRVQPQPNLNRINQPKTYTPRTTPPVTVNRTRTFTPRDRDAAVNSDPKWNNQNWNRNRNRTNRDVVTSQAPSTTVQSNRDWSNRNRNWQNQTNTNRNWQNQTNANRNWQNSNRTNTFTYQQAQTRWSRQRHDRGWWTSHYSRIALFAGGYYYWNDGYWFPAYGYDPYYSSYAYDEPIYGYNNLDPAQVIANVQAALQDQGYYRDQVDGLIGPNTRAALRNFQRDNGLPVTAAIDGPTLEVLGLY